ncbi:MAG: class I SAM-dependent DNA methyltransferase, partial [Devosia sp.]
VVRREGGERSAHKCIDLYKRDCFILEAKQSRWLGGQKAIDGQEEMFGPEGQRNIGRRGAERNWDILMSNARRQAEAYALMLPAEHDWPPFIIVCDVGHAFEIYADFNGKGRDYTQFPDRQGFRIYLEDLRREEVRERLRLVWTDPRALDPTRQAAEATREVAGQLAEVSRSLEQRGFRAEEVASFLMRCLFTMFAEDVELLPKDSFVGLLQECVAEPSIFQGVVGELWAAMNEGRIAASLRARVRHFNGEFFKHPVVLPLNREEIGELLVAASRNWRNVEPAIFGSLLEGALDPRERSKLGAHYTPRAYVERLVVPTIMEPLREDWRAVTVAVEKLVGEGDRKGAIAAVTAFHEGLCKVRVLDPACGTGNFLYVAMEKIKQLEDEVLEALASLGGQVALGFETHRVDPHQFLGLEVNPRAAAIAELVLWIGFLQIHYRSNRQHPNEPILRAFRNIECRDAVLEWDGTGTPRRPAWPEAEFIVGNPPFLGKGSPMRAALGDDYVRALWAANPRMNRSADLVMYWWDRAADEVAGSRIIRGFGFVTTNSLTQVFNRRVVERHLGGTRPLTITFAIPDHPWTKATANAAAVRIAMTVVRRGKKQPGRLMRVLHERALETDQPVIELQAAEGPINADLTIGADLTNSRALMANTGLSSNGMMLAARGFVLSREQADRLREMDGEPARAVIRPFVNGGDLLRGAAPRFVIDLHDRDPAEVRQSAPNVYEHLLQTVRRSRDGNADRAFRERWWLFGRNRPEVRSFTEGSTRYIGTTETAKHRVFQFLPADIVPDHMIVAIGSADAFHLGVLSSRTHVTWAVRAGGWLGVGNDPRYSKSRCFDPFPFPDPDERLKAEIADVAEKLDAHRKAVQAAHPEVTLTQMYNVLEKLRSGGELTPREAVVKAEALVLVLKDYHDELDAAVLRAYGWPAGMTDAEVLERLVALNHERAAEEARGRVRWLRPDYQVPRFEASLQQAGRGELRLVAPEEKGKRSFPADEVDRARAIAIALAAAAGPVSAADIAARFRQGRRVERDIALTLKAYVRYGDVTTRDGGRTFELRRAA